MKRKQADAFSFVFFLSILTSSHPFKQPEEVKDVGMKHFEEEVQMSYELFQDEKPSEGNLSTPVKAPVVSPPGQWGQYNSPVGLYSPETLREMMLMQGKLGEGSAASGGLSSLW